MSIESNNLNKKIELAKNKIQLNELDEAEIILNEILKEKPSSTDALIWLALIKKMLGDLKSSLIMTTKALKFDPENIDIINLIGLYAKEFGDNELSKDNFKKSLEIKVNSNALIGLSTILWEEEEKLKAISYLEKYIDSIKDYRIPMKLSGMQFLEKLYNKSLENACRVILGINDYQIINNLKTPFADSLYYLEKNSFPFSNNNNVILKALEKLLDDGSEYRNLKNGFFKFIFKDINKDIFQTEDSTILDEVFISEYIDSNLDILSNDLFMKNLSSDILVKRLKNSLICCHNIENIYTKTRKYLLSKISTDASTITVDEHKLMCALCIQCDYNGYVWEVTDKENEIIKVLEKKFDKNLSLNKEININQFLIYACYKPIINNVPLIDYFSSKINNNDKLNYEVINALILDPLSLKENFQFIKSFNEIKDQTSLEVMNMYKQHPYPKWKGIFYIPSESDSGKYYSSDLTEMNDPKKKIEILIAGCGTGQELVTFSKLYSKSNITAIDISLPSLSYAYKRAKDNDLNNFELIHMDLLELVNYKKKFDIISCSGVLHHMKDPELGLKALISCLKKDGYLNIGLYSRTARENITQLKELIVDKNLSNNRKAMAKIRKSVILGDDGYESFNHLLNVRDFYSFNELQDLLFHPRELLFNLKEIDEMLKRNNLKFIEFDNKYKNVKRQYQQNYPKDKKLRSIENWSKFEERYPKTFLGMYQFFAKRIEE
tara:strand:- start:441 stop:2603 length:2163 start_codon:yes stop_codon:yes gene_type:complete